MKYLNKGSKAIQILCVLKHIEDVGDVIYINKRSKATLSEMSDGNVTHVGDLEKVFRDVKYLNAM